MKTTAILCVMIVIFSIQADLSFAETRSQYMPVSGSEIQSIAIEEIPGQIAIMQQNIESMSSLLLQMSSVLLEQNLTAEQQKECGAYIGRIDTSLMSCSKNMDSAGVAKQKLEIDQLEKEWNYFETEDFLSH